VIVSITFTGVCAVAPSIPNDGSTYEMPGPLRVTMPLSSRRRNSRPNGPRFIPTHIPFVLAKAPLLQIDALGGAGRPSDDAVTSGGHAGTAKGEASPDIKSPKAKSVGGSRTNVWVPLRERLRIKVDGSYTPGLIKFDPSVYDVVSDIRRVWGDRAKFRRECDPLYPIKHVVDPEVMTQVLVPFGWVEPHFLGDPSGAVFDPPKGEPAVYDQLAPEIVVRFHARELSIASQSLEDGQELDEIVFFGGENDVVDLTIGNSDLDDLRARIEGAAPSRTPGVDADFELYYSLLKDPDNPSSDDDKLPVPIIGGSGLIKDCYVAFVQS